MSGRLLRGEPGTLASLRPDAMSVVLARSADLVVRIDRGSDGPFRVMAVEDLDGGWFFATTAASSCAARLLRPSPRRSRREATATR